MKIAMVAGGSGGHIYPAISLGQALIKKGHEVIYIGSDRMEKDVIPKHGLRFLFVDVKTPRGGLYQKVRCAFSLIGAYFKSKKILKAEKVDLVMGFGNYISVPVILAAKALKLKTVLHEQNSFVGRANRFLDEKVDLIIGSYEEDLKQFHNPNTVILGNPQSSIAAAYPEDPSKIEELGLDPDKRTLIIFLGSLGSESVMKHLLEYFTLTDGSYQIIYATGQKHYPIAKEYANEYIKILPAIDGIGVMKVATLLLSRAGATTLAEISAIGMPSILVPSPYVPNNHQYYNAKALVDKGAAVMLEEKDLSKERIKALVEEYLFDDAKLKALSENAKKLGNDHVIEDIIARIEEL